MGQLNLLRPHKLVLYRLAKRRQTLMLLRRLGGRIAPYDWRAALMEKFEAMVRKEAECE